MKRRKIEFDREFIEQHIKSIDASLELLEQDSPMVPQHHGGEVKEDCPQCSSYIRYSMVYNNLWSAAEKMGKSLGETAMYEESE